MPYNNKRTSDGICLKTNIAMPEKAALSPSEAYIALDKSPCASTTSTPRSDKIANPFETNIEALPSHSSCCRNLAIDAKTDAQVWPGKDHWKKQAKEAKLRRRSCTCMARLSRRNRIIAKVLLIVLVVGAAVSIGFGVSKPLGAPIWGKQDNS